MSISLPKYLHPSFVRSAALQILLVTCVWIVFYHLSTDVLAYFAFNHETFWVFLPAGIRLVAVILFGWVGVVGLFIGSVLTPDDVPFTHVLLLSPILTALTPFHLVVLALMASTYNALMRVGLIHLLGHAQPVFNLLPMFVGDLVGTFIIFYLAVFGFWLARRWVMPPV